MPPRAVAMSIALAKDLFWAAARTARQGRHEVVLVSVDGRPVRCGGGTVITADAALPDVSEVDLAYVGAFWGESGPAETPLVDWLTREHDRGALVAAASTGTVLLAAAGLLDGRIATTYPPAAEAFAARFPRVDLQVRRALTDAGRVFCAAGINSGADLAVSLIERLHGREVAMAVADDFLVDFHRAYWVAHVAFDGQKYHGDEEVLAMQLWLESHHDRPLELRDLATRFGMTPRTLTRRFRAATGELPSAYLRRVRMAMARDLLRDGLGVAQVARRVGYDNVGAFSDAFTRAYGQRPGSFRTSGTPGTP